MIENCNFNKAEISENLIVWNLWKYGDPLNSIKTKIKLQKLTNEETQQTIEKGHVLSLERQQRELVLNTKLEKVYSLKLEIQELN